MRLDHLLSRELGRAVTLDRSVVENIGRLEHKLAAFSITALGYFDQFQLAVGSTLIK